MESEMKIIRIGFKLFGIVLFTRSIYVFVNLISILFTGSAMQKIEYLQMQVILLTIYFFFGTIFAITPNWLVKIFDNNMDNIELTKIDTSSLLKIGVVLIGIYLISINSINIISFITKYAIVFNGYDEYLLKEIKSEAIKQINSCVSIFIGFILIKTEERIGTIIINEGNEKNQ
jgi:hypothetical protein